MGYKVFNTEEIKMKKNFEDVTEAFERFGGRNRQSVQTPKRFSLGAKFVKGYSCEHLWQQYFDPSKPEHKKFLQVKFDESDVGTDARLCTRCGAFSLWEDGHIWAYDAIEIEEEKTSEKPKRSGKR